MPTTTTPPPAPTIPSVDAVLAHAARIPTTSGARRANEDIQGAFHAIATELVGQLAANNEANHESQYAQMICVGAAAMGYFGSSIRSTPQQRDAIHAGMAAAREILLASTTAAVTPDHIALVAGIEALRGR